MVKNTKSKELDINKKESQIDTETPSKRDKNLLINQDEKDTMLTWGDINWSKIERYVYKLQKRIYKASECGDIRKVRKLQKTLLRSGANKLLSIRRVTQDNRGKRTAGVDGIKSISPQKRLNLAQSLKITGKSKPLRRIHIEKSNGELRPLGIPTIEDRIKQAMVKTVIEPEWEAKFEPNSYGFRPARSCHDAIRQIKLSIQSKPKFVLDADIAKCFDRIDHGQLLQKLGYHGLTRRQIKSWLKSGVIENNFFNETEMGTPQGGVISPLLANIALHGMENEIREYWGKKGVEASELGFVRYANDFVIMHKDKKVVTGCKEVIEKWLKNIGLELKPEKTRIAHTLESDKSEDGKIGFNFLGFYIKQVKVGKHRSGKDSQRRPKGYSTLITPTKEKCKEHQRKIKDVIRKSGVGVCIML